MKTKNQKLIRTIAFSTLLAIVIGLTSTTYAQNDNLHSQRKTLLQESTLRSTSSTQPIDRCGAITTQDPAEILRMQNFEKRIAATSKSNLVNKKGQKSSLSANLTIPVVHVVYNTPEQNVSDYQIQSQIVALNEDFRLLNADSIQPAHPFWYYTIDTQLEFCLASVDPYGNFTTGITRTYTTTQEFTANGYEKNSILGGADNWGPNYYLNIWVVNMPSKLGYATWPYNLASYAFLDGITIHYTAFGFVGTATAPYNFGRTATHEIGHWLGLKHIWGDDDGNTYLNNFCDVNECDSTDYVNDTPPACQRNQGSKNVNTPYNAYNFCGSDANGEMFMNYMDYSDDNTTVMFTYEQAVRMYNAINTSRFMLQYSNGCGVATSAEYTPTEIPKLNIYPNPSASSFIIDGFGTAETISLVDITGRVYYQKHNVELPFNVQAEALPNGMYYAAVAIDGFVVSKSLVVLK